jgi:hypothetical protein
MMMRAVLKMRVFASLVLSGFMCGNVLANESTCKRVLEIDPRLAMAQCVCDERLQAFSLQELPEGRLVAGCFADQSTCRKNLSS